MQIAKIIVPVTGGPRDAVALKTAIQAARPFNAHIDAIFAWPDPRDSIPQVGVPLSGEAIESIIAGQAQAASTAARAARDTLGGVAASGGVEIVDKPAKARAVTLRFLQETGRLAPVLLKAARLADLVVFGPIEWALSVDVDEAFLEVLTKSGRPVLLSAEVPPRCLARHVAIGWDNSTAAAHAVTAAMPFLRGAETIDVLCIDGDIDCAPIAECMKLGGLSFRQRVIARDARKPGEVLLDEAAHCGADLLVMGGYGHSHLRETFFGGVTSHLVSHATMPVLMMH